MNNFSQFSLRNFIYQSLNITLKQNFESTQMWSVRNKLLFTNKTKNRHEFEGTSNFLNKVLEKIKIAV